MRTSFSEHTYSMPPRRKERTNSAVMSRRGRLKASEESESTQSSSASTHSNYSETQSSAVTTLSPAVTEVSDQSYLSDESIKIRTKRSQRKGQTTWRTRYESDEDLRRVSLGLRNRRRGDRYFGIDSPKIKTRSRNSGKERVKYTYDDEDFEYDNVSGAHINETVSSRGRVRKFKAHARLAAH